MTGCLGEGVACEPPPEVADTTSGVARGHPQGWVYVLIYFWQVMGNANALMQSDGWAALITYWRQS